jgi:hypothetical protein
MFVENKIIVDYPCISVTCVSHLDYPGWSGWVVDCEWKQYITFWRLVLSSSVCRRERLPILKVCYVKLVLIIGTGQMQERYENLSAR